MTLTFIEKNKYPRAVKKMMSSEGFNTAQSPRGEVTVALV